MIKQVSSFKTSDGQLHPSRHDALKHEFSLELRGMIQSAERNPSGTYTISQVTKILQNNSNLMVKRMQYYNRAISNTKPRQLYVDEKEKE